MLNSYFELWFHRAVICVFCGCAFFWSRVFVPKDQPKILEKARAVHQGRGRKKVSHFWPATHIFLNKALCLYILFACCEVPLGISVPAGVRTVGEGRGKGGCSPPPPTPLPSFRNFWTFRVKRRWFVQKYSGENILKGSQGQACILHILSLTSQNGVKVTS